ncbi:hypothetical protein [Saccharopolyspora hattusasensis]|uniref:hypothetical protein n=1 Tax=Saccharopolyspora hattusasensis TaxID=1128679 RepID=UPI003D97005C
MVGTTRTREEAGEGSRAPKRPKVQGPAVEAGSGNHGGKGDGPAPTNPAAQQDPSAEKKPENRDSQAANREARKVEAARVEELKGKGEGQLNEKEKDELATLQRKVEQRKKKKQKNNANYRKLGKDVAAR